MLRSGNYDSIALRAGEEGTNSVDTMEIVYR